MTFDELVRKVAAKHGMGHTRKGGAASHGKTLRTVERIIRDALNLAADAAKDGKAPLFPGIGRFVMKPMRATGRKVDGTVWTNPGRTKLAFSTSTHRTDKGKSKSASESAAA